MPTVEMLLQYLRKKAKVRQLLCQGHAIPPSARHNCLDLSEQSLEQHVGGKRFAVNMHKQRLHLGFLEVLNCPERLAKPLGEVRVQAALVLVKETAVQGCQHRQVKHHSRATMAKLCTQPPSAPK